MQKSSAQRLVGNTFKNVAKYQRKYDRTKYQQIYEYIDLLACMHDYEGDLRKQYTYIYVYLYTKSSNSVECLKAANGDAQ